MLWQVSVRQLTAGRQGDRALLLRRGQIYFINVSFRNMSCIAIFRKLYSAIENFIDLSEATCCTELKSRYLSLCCLDNIYYAWWCKCNCVRYFRIDNLSRTRWISNNSHPMTNLSNINKIICLIILKSAGKFISSPSKLQWIHPQCKYSSIQNTLLCGGNFYSKLNIFFGKTWYSSVPH